MEDNESETRLPPITISTSAYEQERVLDSPESSGSHGLSDEDAEEEDEEEPLFKYRRQEGEVERIFGKDSACAIFASEKSVAIGTQNGVVYILNHRSEILKRFRPHAAFIHDIKLDTSDQFVATASMDGKISILQLVGGNDVFIQDLKRPMRSIALEPLYHKHPNKRHYVSGGLAGNLILHEKGWLGNKETILHSGEGPIWSADWKLNYVVWANDAGIRIIDITTHQKIAFIPRSQSEPRADLYRCHFSWPDTKTLLVGWANTIRVISITDQTFPTLGPRGGPVAHHSATTVKVLDIFEVDCTISGLCAWGEAGDLAVLAHTLQTYEEEGQDEDQELRSGSSKRRLAERPELRIISKLGEETSSDALSINCFERYQAHDYLLSPLPASSGFYVLSPQDLILVELRNRSDHINWLIEHQDYEQAMREVEAAGLAGAQGFSLSEIGKKYLDHLLHQGKYQTAAEASPAILGNDSKAWEDWIFLLTEKGQLETIVPYVPVDVPRLSKLVYEVILVHLLRKEPDRMLEMIRKWPSELYNVSAVISATQDRLNRANDDGPSEVLMTCLSELYILNHQPGKALTFFLRLKKPEVFELIKDHNLFTDVQDQVLLLLRFDDELNQHVVDNPSNPSDQKKKRAHGTAINLLVEHTHSIPVPRVVVQLVDHRRYLSAYLDALFDVDPLLATDYSDLHVDLFAEFDRVRLMEYLRASNTYSLAKAYQICDGLDFVPEMVYLLGRMGDNKKALFLIIDRIGDVQRAIEFAKEQNDNDLWEDLLRYSESRPAFIRGLLNNVGSEIDPVRLIRRISNGLEIEGLRASIIKILHDFNLQISLIEGCRSIMANDCRDLSKMYYASQTVGVLGDKSLRCQKCGLKLDERPGEEETAVNEISVMFLCRHTFHAWCVFEQETVLAALAEGRGVKGQKSSAESKFEQTVVLMSGVEGAGCVICCRPSVEARISVD
ncbi:hypothetical protein CROQUDRAFT_52527 [Cronartium quercuum f. sp. fusiforme G11]|uniref:Vacuolar protein sorting-associated protein 41 n=1 Tax=Cronartium quercuum f. sp. fusiforme G11 TaxID=708437 RepID=A0A9P6T6U5_9BASI|nr:hypothetical protein CROQUDRAFT_52527 [Cronartium quercuum f. sp. fusiforme G11]